MILDLREYRKHIKMEDKEISQYTLGEKIGFIMSSMQSVEKKLDKTIEENCKRLVSCEDRLRDHDLIVANAKGKVTILGIIWGGISGIGSALLVWWLTR